MNRSRIAVAVAGLSLSASAGAASWGSFNSVGLTSGSIYCSTTTCQTTTAGLTGSIITMSAYSTPTLNASGTSSPVDTGNWLDARIRIYSGSGGGIAIANNVQPSTTEASSPQHAIDNRGVNDLLVVDFGSDYWDLSSFTIGYACKMYGASSSDTSPSCNGSSVNVDAWLGGSGAIDFNTVSFAGGVPTGGFTQLTLNPDIGGTGLRNDTSNPDVVGRYLVIAGSLGGYKDAFKVTGIEAEYTPPPPPPGGNNVPLPGSVPLLAAGLVGLWASRRTLARRR
ncbi:MAG: VPLPA-CTERM sorting domain-containing protein [Burkholderiales bacterium]|nr:VPLPA-CTERM sorting domain-containing protein [Burkholderiales bacterium]